MVIWELASGRETSSYKWHANVRLSIGPEEKKNEGRSKCTEMDLNWASWFHSLMPAAVQRLQQQLHAR